MVVKHGGRIRGRLLRWLRIDAAHHHLLAQRPFPMAPELLPKYGPFDLSKAVALITGGSSGIGFGMAEELLKAGSTVIVTGRRESALTDTQAKLSNSRLHTFVNDASKVLVLCNTLVLYCNCKSIAYAACMHASAQKH